MQKSMRNDSNPIFMLQNYIRIELVAIKNVFSLKADYRKDNRANDDYNVCPEL